MQKQNQCLMGAYIKKNVIRIPLSTVIGSTLQLIEGDPNRRTIHGTYACPSRHVPDRSLTGVCIEKKVVSTPVRLKSAVPTIFQRNGRVGPNPALTRTLLFRYQIAV